MDTRQITAEYRLTHWSRVLQEHHQSGLIIKDYCESIGIHPNTYYYWQRKVREATYTPRKELDTQSISPTRFAEVKVYGSPNTSHPSFSGEQGTIRMEMPGLTISADSSYPSAKLIEILKGLVSC